MIEKQYSPAETEGKIYRFWEEHGYFKPTATVGKKIFSMVMPPPNITGSLHMGHALNNTIQDILVRYKRMEGYSTLWVPGIDHAGIAMQNVVEKELRKENLSRHILGRDKFLEKCWEWKEKYGNVILGQIKTMGASCDWTKTRFTMDEQYTKAVQTAFLHYYDKGLVYRGKRIVNWCPRCRTSLSDLEITYEEEKGFLWHIKYPLIDHDSIIVATTRPETMLGDVAIAVNPKDPRYKKLIGKKAKLPLTDRELPIIGDSQIDINFGTGAVKITPAHDLNDYVIAGRHKLPILEIIDTEGRINKNVPPPYQGLKVLQAREKIIEDLKSAGLLVKTEDYAHPVPHCQRCHATIELLPSEQWFLKMKSLAAKAAKAARNKKTIFHPRNWKKSYLDWLDHTQDWCLSRQLWWGHQMPVWECQNSKGFFVSVEVPQSCPKCKNCKPVQTQDVFDTWFSSALWPFAVFGWPQQTADLKLFYPTNTLSTARDIINLWVGRMVYSGLEFTKKPPFRDVIIHATILAKDGRRMSKSLGTGIDPLALTEKYGADATRMGIIWQVVDQQDVKFSEDPIIAGKKFCNKIWNATRFVLQNIGEKQFDLCIIPQGLTTYDTEILSRLNAIIKSTTDNIESYQFGRAIRDLYDFFWHDFCDVYIEKSKSQLQAPQMKENTEKILIYTINCSLKLLHPFVPFVTEELYQMLPVTTKKEALIIENWPKYENKQYRIQKSVDRR